MSNFSLIKTGLLSVTTLLLMTSIHKSSMAMESPQLIPTPTQTEQRQPITVAQDKPQMPMNMDMNQHNMANMQEMMGKMQEMMGQMQQMMVTMTPEQMQEHHQQMMKQMQEIMKQMQEMQEMMGNPNSMGEQNTKPKENHSQHHQ